MRKQPRNSDGTLCQANQPKQLTNRSLIARWVEVETLHLKRLGMSYQAIADHLARVAHGRQKADGADSGRGPVSQGLQHFYAGGSPGVSRGIIRLPNAEAVELRTLDRAL
jgi:hypothetical protein